MAATPRKRNLFFFFLGFLATDSSVVVSVALSLGVVSTSEFREHHGHLLPKAGGLIRSVTGILRALVRGFYSSTPRSRDPRVPPAKAHRLKRVFFSGRA